MKIERKNVIFFTEKRLTFAALRRKDSTLLTKRVTEDRFELTEKPEVLRKKRPVAVAMIFLTCAPAN